MSFAGTAAGAAAGWNGQRTAAPARAPRRAWPLRVLRGVYVLVALLLFTVGGGLLWKLGLNYDGISGAMASKIHPATYLTVAGFVLLLLSRRNPAAILATLLTRERGPSVMLLGAAFVFVFAVLSRRPGMAGLIDTYMFPALLAIIAAEVGDARTKSRVESLLHVVLAANAVLTVWEAVRGIDLIPYVFDGRQPLEHRPSGLQGIAVSNALLIGTYLVALVGRGGTQLRGGLRLATVGLQFAALVSCGERAAAVLATALVLLLGLRAVAKVLAGARVGRTAALSMVLAPPLVAISLALAGPAGAFDLLSRRFQDDGGSAQSRIEMFAIFERLNTRDVLLAPDVDMVDSIRRAYGLELGIENPVIHTLLYQGALSTAVLFAGLFGLLHHLARTLSRGYGPSFFYFLLTMMSFESIGTKTVVLAKFAVMMTVLFRGGTVSIRPKAAVR